jgi:TPR repeat protein
MGGLAAVAVGIAAVVLVPALRGSRTAAPTERVADTPAASSAAPSMLPTDSVFGGAMPADDERKRTETRRALAGSPEALQVYEARARQGSAEAQYRLAVIYECGDKNLPLAKRWYEAAAAQGHVAARNALAALQAPLPSDAREREIADIRRDMNCLGRLQENANDANLENDNRAKEAIKRIKPG